MDVFEYLFVVMVVGALCHSSVDAQGVPPFGVQAIRENWKVTLIVTFSFLLVAFIFFLVFRFQSPRSSHECKNEDTPNNKVIENCPIFVYATAKELKLGNEAMECTVCLSEFEDKDTIKMLPKCAHVFHQQCIDNWLPSHMTCPICRHNLTSDTIHTPFNTN